MGNAIDITGQKFGRLIVIEKTNQRTKCRQIIYRCLCDCGNETSVSSGHLRSGNTRSCGCMEEENRKKVIGYIKHGATKNGQPTSEYLTWKEMKRRCLNPRYKFYHCYGGRGIKVCEKWRNSFEAFLQYLKDSKMYPKSVGMSIDRIENNGHYEPGNIRWATPLQQRQNQRAA